MGQFYKIIFLADFSVSNDISSFSNEYIIMWVSPEDYNMNLKMMHHAFIGNEMVQAIEFCLCPYGEYHKCRLVWAGDYADYEKNNPDNNLYSLAIDEDTNQIPESHDMSLFNYIVNHTKKQYINKNNLKKSDLIIHPLPLLVSEGNGKGWGDYYGYNSELCGIWARDVISVEQNISDDYTELICNFHEY